MKCLYKYPQAEFPYARSAGGRTAGAGRGDPEYELLDTGVFAENRYFDVFVEYAKAAPEDILVRIESQSRARGGLAARAAHRLVPQPLVVGISESARILRLRRAVAPS